MREQATATEQALCAGVARLLARATEPHALDAEALLPRVRAALEKYLLRARPAATVEEIGDFLDNLRADDVCLAAACARGDEAAWRDLMEGFRATVLSAARGASANEGAAEELAESVWGELYGLRGGGGAATGKLAYYSGCGSLGGWLRAVVGQLAIDRHRKTARLVQTEATSDFDRLASEQSALVGDGFMPRHAPDPEQSLARREATRALHQALTHVLAELAAEDRLLLKLYYLDDLRLREAGAVLGIHEATASRRLTRLHAEVRRLVEASLRADHGWTQQEIARSLSATVAHLDADVRRLLVAETPGGQPSEDLQEELYE